MRGRGLYHVPQDVLHGEEYLAKFGAYSTREENKHQACRKERIGRLTKVLFLNLCVHGIVHLSHRLKRTHSLHCSCAELLAWRLLFVNEKVTSSSLSFNAGTSLLHPSSLFLAPVFVGIAISRLSLAVRSGARCVVDTHRTGYSGGRI